MSQPRTSLRLRSSDRIAAAKEKSSKIVETSSKSRENKTDKTNRIISCLKKRESSKNLKRYIKKREFTKNLRDGFFKRKNTFNSVSELEETKRSKTSHDIDETKLKKSAISKKNNSKQELFISKNKMNDCLRKNTHKIKRRRQIADNSKDKSVGCNSLNLIPDVTNNALSLAGSLLPTSSLNNYSDYEEENQSRNAREMLTSDSELSTEFSTNILAPPDSLSMLSTQTYEANSLNDFDSNPALIEESLENISSTSKTSPNLQIEDLKYQLKKATIKFNKACRQLVFMDQHMSDLQSLYNNSITNDRRTFKIVYRMQLATLEGTHNAYIEYIERQVEKIKRLKRLLFSENTSEDNINEVNENLEMSETNNNN
jgi:hypothetical protein